jgi:hypothetical protein
VVRGTKQEVQGTRHEIRDTWYMVRGTLNRPVGRAHDYDGNIVAHMIHSKMKRALLCKFTLAYTVQ